MLHKRFSFVFSDFLLLLGIHMIKMDSKAPLENSLKKRKLVRATIEFKKEIISKFESGIRVKDLALEYRMPRSTIFSILKNRQVIKAADVAKGVKTITKQRPQVLEDVEKLLLLWLNKRRSEGHTITEPVVCEKAKQLHADLLLSKPETSSKEGEMFKASHGWYENFKKRSGLNRQESGSLLLADNIQPDGLTTAQKFVRDFKDYLAIEGLTPQQVFGCNETGLLWKKLPKKTFLAKEEMSLPGHRPSSDRITLLLCANASADLRLKPLLVYHSENPRAFRKKHVNKSALPVLWRSHPKEWVTRRFLADWMNEVFGPVVKVYLRENNLPPKALVLLDSTFAVPVDLEDSLLEEFGFVSLRFLPPDAAASLRPMGQEVFAELKRLYLKVLLERCFAEISNGEVGLREFWKNHFDILQCIHFVDKAWRQVPDARIHSGWKNLWSEIVARTDFEWLGTLTVRLNEEIVTLAQSLNLEMSCHDLEELMTDQKKELTTEELQELQKEQEKPIPREISLKAEDIKQEMSTSAILDVCAKWAEVQHFVLEHHPDRASTSRQLTVMNKTIFSYFEEILQKRDRNGQQSYLIASMKSSNS